MSRYTIYQRNLEDRGRVSRVNVAGSKSAVTSASRWELYSLLLGEFPASA